MPMSGFVWDTYTFLEEQGELDHIKRVPFEDGSTFRILCPHDLVSSPCIVHPQLHFISHIPQNIKGEQLIAQLFRNIGSRSWLFKYGAVPMSFIMGEWLFEVRIFMRMRRCHFLMLLFSASLQLARH